MRGINIEEELFFRRLFWSYLKNTMKIWQQINSLDAKELDLLSKEDDIESTTLPLITYWNWLVGLIYSSDIFYSSANINISDSQDGAQTVVH